MTRAARNAAIIAVTDKAGAFHRAKIREVGIVASHQD
jgi:hypothetical protein